MKRPKPESVNLDTLTGQAVNLRAVAGDAMMQAALVIVRERLALTPEKLAAMLLHIINPNESLYVTEECAMRGVSDKTLAGMRQRKEIPAVLGSGQAG